MINQADSAQGPIANTRRTSSTFGIFKTIEAITGVRELAEDEFKTYRNKAMSGTCRWITHKPDFLAWVKGNAVSRNASIFWLIGLPAMGKTVLASYVIDYILMHGASKDCQYHFFSAGHQNKRTAAYCLRSIATQLALANEEFRGKLFSLQEETGLSFNSQDQKFGIIWEKIFEGLIFKMQMKPLYWVLDAFDEADVPSALIACLMKIHSLTPIRIFVTSRPIRIPSGPATCGSMINTCFLSEDDTSDDIRAYVSHTVSSALPNDEQEIRDEIIEQFLSKAGGSFLWVKLALEILHDNWHTQDDIQKVLTEMPRGMEHLYMRMLEKIETQSPRLELMAKRILTWVTCSWRPLAIAELQTALEPEFSGFVRLEETIIQICGNFVSVDNDKVSLIHTTARQFLLTARDDNPAFIESGAAHEHIAIVCLKHLSNEKWKRTFKDIETATSTATKSSTLKNRLLLAETGNPFLGYSVCYYAYHISKSALDSEQIPAILMNFFTRYCLSWIEAIALSRNLKYLIRSARFLKSYAKRRARRRKLSIEYPLSLRDSDSDDSTNIHLWAIDFVRIVGKFGPNLMQSPSSVYRLVPPFCPRASMIGTTYCPQEGSISVTGLLSEGWDDCLASVSTGKEAATKVLAADAFFLTLISSGTVIVWYAETCEEARRIQHGEYVSLMEVDRSHRHLATAGSQNYRVWDISSGKQLYELGKTSRALPMAIAFGSVTSELIIGLDACSVTCYDLQTSLPSWQFTVPSREEHHGCPLIMSISPDLTKLAVAWRGKLPLVWDLRGTGTQRPLQCRVRNSSDALFAPLSMQWHANANSIMILCHNTKLVEWHIYDEEQHEFDHVKPHEMNISQDGNFLLTSDHMGTISVFTFPRLSLIYQLVNDNELIENLAFSPDAQRFYDIRGSVCNVWEPDALVRPDDYELEDWGSSVATEPVIAHDESSQTRVTALDYSLADNYYCIGREDGTVCIHDAYNGKKVRKVSAHSSHSSVIILAWSFSDKFIISGDDSGRIIAKRLETREQNTFRVYPLLDLRVDEPVQQFLVNEIDNLLLISTISTDRIWDLKSKKQLCCRPWNSTPGRRWIQHPFDRKLLLWIDPCMVHTYTWRALEHADIAQTPPVEPLLPNPTKSHGKDVHWVALTSNKQYIVYLSGTGHTGTQISSGLHLEFLSTSDLQVQHPQSLTSDCMTELAAQIKRLIGTYQDQIVFLDHDYWLCTWSLEASIDDVKRHFFLPKDWLNRNTLHMATLNAHGTFFCPKHGNVGVVRHGMRF